jgi:hypothetical protein
MMLIGTSFGGCLNSILSGEVSEDDVLLIIGRTECKSLEAIINLAERYYREGNIYASVPGNYQFDESINLEHVRSLAARLYLAGKIHQPRTYEHGSGFIHPEMSRAALWMEVSPIGLNDNPAVIEAYEKYKILNALTK